MEVNRLTKTEGEHNEKDVWTAGNVLADGDAMRRRYGKHRYWTARCGRSHV